MPENYLMKSISFTTETGDHNFSFDQSVEKQVVECGCGKFLSVVNRIHTVQVNHLN